MAVELMGCFDQLVREFLVTAEAGSYSASEKSLLRLLDDHGPRNMSEISSHLGLALSSTTGVVDRLVERRAVERSRSESDRRTVRVMLTTRGRRVLEGFYADRIRLGRAMLERLEPNRRQTLLDIFRRIARPPA
jgi:DNA-binding MarR family transcriptional regulator